MSEISFAELEQEGSELLPERAVLSTLSMPLGGNDGGASYDHTSHQSWSHAGPDGATYGESSSSTHSAAGSGNGGLLGGLL